MAKVDDLYDFPAIKAQADKVFALLDQTVQRINALNAMNINFNFGGRGGAAGGAANGAAQADALAKAIERLNLAQSQLGQEIATVNEQTRQQNVVNRQNAQATLAQNGSLNSLRAALNQLTRQYDNLSAAERNNINVGRQMVGNIQQLQQEIRTLEQETGRFQRNVGNYPKALVGGLTNLAGAFGLATGVAAIGATAKAVYDTTLQLDSLNSALRAVSKTEQEFAINQKFLLETSDRLGLNILDLTQSYKLFYAASTLSGLSAKETRKIFNSVAESAATLKLSTQDTQGVLLAFSQILGKGKVQAEELRGQIGERVPGAFKIAANAIGVTEQQLNKMLETGQVVAKDFLPKFAAELEKNFGAGTDRVEGLQASVNRLSNTFTSLIADNQSGLSKFFTLIIDGATLTIGQIEKLTTGLSYLYNIVADANAAENMVDSQRLKNFSKDQEKASLTTQLDNLNTINAEIIRQTKLLSVQQAALKEVEAQARDTNNRVSDKTLTDAEKSVKEIQTGIDLLKKRQEILRSLIDKQLPEGEESPASVGLTAAQLKEQSRLREMQIKAALDANKITVQSAIDSQLEIINNDKFTTYERLNALENYNTLRLGLVHDNEESEKRILKENIKQKQAVAEQEKVINARVDADEIKITREGQKLQADIVKSGDDKALAAIVDQGENRKTIIEANAIKELSKAKELHDQELLSDAQYNDLRKQIENKFQVESLQSEVEYIQQIIALRKLRGENTADDERKLLDIQNKINRLGLEDFIKVEKEKTKAAEDELKLRERAEKAFNQRSIELARALADLVVNIIGGQYERQKEIVDKELQDVETRKQADIDAVNESLASEDEKAAQISLIKIRAQQQEEMLNERKKQIELQQARFEKAKSAASIVQHTASAIVRTFADFPYYIALPLSVIIGATGAAQLASVLATPIPRYKDGISYSPEGLAIVGDGGRNEVVESKFGTYLTPATDTLTYLPKGSTVHKSVDDYYNSIGGLANSKLFVNSAGQLSMDKVTKEIKAMGSNVVGAVRANRSMTKIIYTFNGMKVTQEKFNSLTNYLSKNVNL